ncbi:hypothetical protein SAMN05421640_1540 [Ekhidna lutea]|uniref:Uncharacterized protein n=1 Tax=Ekhidna lutea TaxID=447679 RepID=A0A239HXX8_EKHLU|nr:hypothetical protein [Ekhidna lutea]SNS85543.1 hypothetical protein SAMN05421640_1540 [Ekhidna lutea]
MSISDLKLNLHKIIDEETDVSRLEAIFQILNDTGTTENRLSLEEYNNIIDSGRKQIREGKFKTHDQVKNILNI